MSLIGTLVPELSISIKNMDIDLSIGIAERILNVLKTYKESC
jgi:hypothetical protein